MAGGNISPFSYAMSQHEQDSWPKVLNFGTFLSELLCSADPLSMNSQFKKMTKELRQFILFVCTQYPITCFALYGIRNSEGTKF